MERENSFAAPNRALVLKDRIIQRKETIQVAIQGSRSPERIAELQRVQSEDEREYRDLLDNH